MPSHGTDYDVVIVGGRPAGASLAARLGARGISTLVVDRARFPSMPAVPSCAIVYPHTMSMLEEVGVTEDEIGEHDARCHRFTITIDSRFTSIFSLAEAHGRDYFYGIHRDRFDLALWQALARHPSVTTLDQTSCRGVLRGPDGRVIGVQLQTADGGLREITSRIVVGADGRFSPMARRVGAKARMSFPRSSTCHFATWEGVQPFDDGSPTFCVFTTARGLDVLFFPAPRGRVHVCTHVRADRMKSEGPIDDYYQRTIRSLPGPRERLASARQVGPLVGLKRIANGYREPTGPGWALVGDAFHFKDPIDGQGIYDAMVESKILAEELVAWLGDQKSEAEALASYDHRAMEVTLPMYEATTKRLDRELYDEPPSFVVSTILRWLLNDPRYKRRFVEYLCREVHPGRWMTPSLVGGALARGALGDLRRLLSPGRRTET